MVDAIARRGLLFRLADKHRELDAYRNSLLRDNAERSRLIYPFELDWIGFCVSKLDLFCWYCESRADGRMFLSSVKLENQRICDKREYRKHAKKVICASVIWLESTPDTGSAASTDSRDAKAYP